MEVNVQFMEKYLTIWDCQNIDEIIQERYVF